MKRDTAVEAMRPPMSETAIGIISSVASPIPRAIGIIPTIVVTVVMRIGLIRTAPASVIASSLPICSLFWEINSTSRIALFTTIPTSMIKPIIAIIESFCPVRKRARKAPDMANGIENITMNGSATDSN